MSIAGVNIESCTDVGVGSWFLSTADAVDDTNPSLSDVLGLESAEIAGTKQDYGSSF